MRYTPAGRSYGEGSRGALRSKPRVDWLAAGGHPVDLLSSATSQFIVIQQPCNSDSTLLWWPRCFPFLLSIFKQNRI
jgi:hypothetical protein